VFSESAHVLIANSFRATKVAEALFTCPDLADSTLGVTYSKRYAVETDDPIVIVLKPADERCALAVSAGVCAIVCAIH
jgi:hypothetical protein